MYGKREPREEAVERRHPLGGVGSGRRLRKTRRPPGESKACGPVGPIYRSRGPAGALAISWEANLSGDFRGD